ncbi:putative ribonuclease H-like domain-containing protein [Tanacetum coccineum]
MRTKPGVDNLSIDDLYNNLRVFESDINGSTGSSSSAQNVAFVSSESTNSTNDVSTAYDVSTSSSYNSQRENSPSYTDELMYSFFANQSNGPHLDHGDLKQLDEFDLEKMDLKWQVAMISMRLKKFYKKTGRRLHFDAKEPVGFDKTKVECFNCHNTRHFARECRSKGNQESRRKDAGNTGYRAKDNGRRPGKQEEPKALVTLDGEGVDWTDHAEDEQENFGLMAYSNSSSDTEVTSCFKECMESYAKLKKLFDEQREQLGAASIEIQAYTQALKKVEAQVVTHLEKSTLKLLAEAVKEKEELKTKLENFQSSSKGLSKLLNSRMSQMSTRNKSGLGHGNQIHKGILSYEKEVLESVFDSRLSDVEDNHVHDRFANSNSSLETLESVLEPVVVKPKVVSQPKVWSDAPIIEEYEVVSQLNFSQLIKDYDFHEKRMAKQVELNQKKGKGTGQGENRPGNLYEVYLQRFSKWPIFVLVRKESNTKASCTQNIINSGNSKMEVEPAQDYLVLPIWSSYTSTVKSSETKNEVADFSNLESTVNVSPIPTSRIISIIIQLNFWRIPKSAFRQGAKFTKNFPYGKKAIGTKWVYRNKKDERGVMVRNKASLGLEAIRIFLALLLILGFIVYQMDVKCASCMKKIDEEVYVSSTLGFVDPNSLRRFYKAWCVEDCRTLIETQKSLTKDEEAADVNYVLVLGFSTPKTYPLNDVKRSLDSEYAGANLDRKSATRGCQFLGRRLISWQYKKQTIVATTKAEYVAAANWCGQVLWIQNQITQCFTPKQSILRLGTTSLGMGYEKEAIQGGKDGSVYTVVYMWIEIVPRCLDYEEEIAGSMDVL